MFTYNDMRALLAARPFVPFRLWLSDGRAIEVPSPNLVLPGRHYAIVGFLNPSAPDEPYDQYVTVWYTYVKQHEALVPGASLFAPPGEPPSGTPTPASGS